MVTIQEYCRLRNEMLMKRDPQALIDFSKERLGHAPTSLEAAEIAMHQMTTAIRSMPMELRVVSKKWLIERGHHPLDDGDVKCARGE